MHSERGKKTRRTKEEMGRQRQGMDKPGVWQVPEGSGEQGKMEKTGRKIICGAPTTLAVKGLMMMMMILSDQSAQPEATVIAFVTIRFPESKFRNERTGAVPRLELGLQRLLHPSWARESAGCMRGEVKVRLRHSGMSSNVRELPLRSSPE